MIEIVVKKENGGNSCQGKDKNEVVRTTLLYLGYSVMEVEQFLIKTNK
jgi:hypothetical protein